MDLSNYIRTSESRYQELERAISAFDFGSGDNKQYEKLNREYTKLKKLLGDWNELNQIHQQLADNRELLGTTEDQEFLELIRSDIEGLEARQQAVDSELKTLILPTHPNEGKDLIVEIRPAAGGDEAGIFAGDLYRMYSRYCELKGWRTSVLELSEGNVSGSLKSVSFNISGDDAWSIMHFESGVHRVQRVPETEAQGRVHTSTVTVAVMAEAEEVDFELNPDELRIDVFRSSGHGGQCVNTTDSAVRVTHIPTGIFVASQQEKSQHKNKAIAMRILRSRLLEIKQSEEDAKNAAERKSQVGTGDRSERIRTYNYPQNRVTDHRYEITLYDLTKIMEGNLDGLLGEIRALDAEHRLEDELNVAE